MLDFLQMFIHYGELPIKVLEQRLPAYICDEFSYDLIYISSQNRNFVCF